MIINGVRTEIKRENSGNIVIGVENGSITIKDCAFVNYDRNTVQGQLIRILFTNYANKVTIDGGAGKDKIV